MKESHVPENTNSHHYVDLNNEVGEFSGRLGNFDLRPRKEERI